MFNYSNPETKKSAHAGALIGAAPGLLVSFIGGITSIDDANLALTLSITLIPPFAGAIIGAIIGASIQNCKQQQEGSIAPLNP